MIGAKPEITEEIALRYSKQGASQSRQQWTGFQVTPIERLLPEDTEVLESRLCLTLFAGSESKTNDSGFHLRRVWVYAEFISRITLTTGRGFLRCFNACRSSPCQSKEGKTFEDYLYDGPEISLPVFPEPGMAGTEEPTTDRQSNRIYLAPISADDFGATLQGGGDCWWFHSTTSYAMDANKRPRLILNCTGSVEIPTSAYD